MGEFARARVSGAFVRTRLEPNRLRRRVDGWKRKGRPRSSVDAILARQRKLSGAAGAEVGSAKKGRWRGSRLPYACDRCPEALVCRRLSPGSLTADP